MGGTRGKKGLTINNYSISGLADGGNTGLMLEIRLLDEGGSGICGAAVTGGARF